MSLISYLQETAIKVYSRLTKRRLSQRDIALCCFSACAGSQYGHCCFPVSSKQSSSRRCKACNPNSMLDTQSYKGASRYLAASKSHLMTCKPQSIAASLHRAFLTHVAHCCFTAAISKCSKSQENSKQALGFHSGSVEARSSLYGFDNVQIEGCALFKGLVQCYSPQLRSHSSLSQLDHS